MLGLVRARDFTGAATEVLGCYGSEIYGFLINLLGAESDATEVYLQVGEDLWRGLPGFAARSSIRTWIYVLARNAAAKYRRTPWHRRDRRASGSQLDDILARTRSQTSPWLRTDTKNHLRALRESLSDEDRTILALRVDRGLAWDEVARVTLGSDDPEARTLTRETARVTKRYQLIKEQLRKRAREAGIIEDAE